jgi:hypothetical protein
VRRPPTGKLVIAAAVACIVTAALSFAGAENATAGAAASTSSDKSCLWYKGKRKWCLVDGWSTDERYIEVLSTRQGVRVYVWNQKEETLGYLRATGPGRWRAMWNTFGDGWVRGGRAVRVTRNTYHVFEAGRRRGIARGPAAIAVAALKLLSGDCVTDGPNQTTCIA